MTATPVAPLQLVPAPPKPFRREGLGYVYEPRREDGLPVGVRLRVDYLHRRTDDLTGEVVIESMLPGEPTHIHQARLNLTSTTARASLAKHLKDVARGGLDWLAVLERFCAAVLRAERQGEPFLLIGCQEEEADPPALISRLLPAGQVSTIYGPGGVGKGWLAVSCVVCVLLGRPLAGLVVRQGIPLYLDWEDSPAVMNRRLRAIARGMELREFPEIHYRRCRGALRNQVHQIARFIRERGVTFLVVDSVEKASGAAGEHGTYEDKAEMLFEALDHLAVETNLLIDHVSAGEKEETKGVRKVYGSVMKENWVRNAWEMRKDQEVGGLVSHIGLYHAKVNHGPLQTPLGFCLDFSTPNTVRLTREDVRESEELSQPLPLRDRIEHALVRGPQSVHQLAEMLGASEEKVAAALKAGANRRFTRMADGRWGAAVRSRGDMSLREVELPW